MPVSINTFSYGINRIYVIKQEGTIMIDGGPPNIAKKFESDLEKEKIDPGSIKLMVLTHADFDHAGSAASIRNLTGAKIAIHRKDKEVFEQARFNWPPGTTVWGTVSRSILKPMLSRTKMEPAEADIILTDKTYPLFDYGIDGHIVYTPGHTRGHVSVVLNNGIGFIGCMAHNIRLFRMKPNLPIYGESLDEIRSSWRKILDMGVTTAYPAHGKPFPVDVIAKYL